MNCYYKLLSLSVMTFNQLDNLLSFIFSQFINLINAFFIFENSVNLQNFISDMIKVNELSFIFE